MASPSPEIAIRHFFLEVPAHFASAQLAKEVELVAAKAASAGHGSNGAVEAVVAAAAKEESRKDVDPPTLFPNELPGWQALSPEASDGSSYDLTTTLAIGAECLELALNEGMGRGEIAGIFAFPRSVFNVLLRRVPTPRRNMLSLDL